MLPENRSFVLACNFYEVQGRTSPSPLSLSHTSEASDRSYYLPPSILMSCNVSIVSKYQKSTLVLLHNIVSCERKWGLKSNHLPTMFPTVIHTYMKPYLLQPWADIPTLRYAYFAAT